MSNQLNNQVFAYAKQLSDSAFKAHSIALKGLEKVADLQISTLEKRTQATSQFIAEALETRDIDGLRNLWEKGANLSREQAEHAVAVSQEVLAVTQKTAESLSALAHEQQQVVNGAVNAPVNASKKGAAR